MRGFSYTSHVGFNFIWGVSLTHPVLASILSGGFLLYIPCRLQFYLGSFSYTSHACLIFLWGVYLTHHMPASILSGEFLLHIPCYLFFVLSFFSFYLRSFSYTSHTCLLLLWGCFSDTYHAGFHFIWGVSLTHPVLASVLSEEFLLHIPCWLQFYLGSFSYTSRAGFNCMRGVSLTHPVLASVFIWRVSVTHPMLAWFFSSFFLSYASHAGFNFIWVVSLTHPVLASILSGEFLLHIPCWLLFYLGSFSYTSRAGFICIRDVSLTHPELVRFLMLASFSFFIWGVSLTYPILGWFFFGEFLLHLPCWL